MSVSKLSLLFHNCKLISTLTTYLSGARLLVSNLVLTSLGTVKDYYLAYSLDNNTKTLGFPTKNFFWCSSSNYIFATLPLQMEKYSFEFSQMNFFSQVSMIVLSLKMQLLKLLLLMKMPDLSSQQSRSPN